MNPISKYPTRSILFDPLKTLRNPTMQEGIKGIWAISLTEAEPGIVFSSGLQSFFGAEYMDLEAWLGQFHSEDRHLLRQHIRRYLQAQEAFQGSFHCQHQDGRWYSVSIGGDPLQSLPQQLGGWLDISPIVSFSDSQEGYPLAANWVLDTERMHMEYSPELIAMYQFEQDEVTPENIVEKIYDRIHPDDRHQINAYQHETLDAGLFRRSHFRIILPDGSIKRLLVADGQFIDDHRMVGTTIDVTWPEAHDHLLRMVDLLTLEEKTWHVGFGVWNPERQIAELSPNLFRLFGLEDQTVSREDSLEIMLAAIHPDDRPMVDQVLLDLGKLVHESKEAVFRLKARGEHTSRIRMKAYIQSDPRLIVGMFEDVTEEWLREQKVMAQQRMLEEGESVSQTSTYIWDLAKNTIHFTPEMYDLLELSPEELTSENMFDWVMKRMHPEDMAFAQELVHTAMEKKEIWDGTYRFLMPDGRIRWMRSQGGRFFGENQVIGTKQDVTKFKEQEQELRRTNQELENLVHTVAHDLRAPLRHILSYGFMSQEAIADNNPAEATDMLTQVVAASERLGVLMDELLQYSRARRITLNYEYISLAEFLPTIQAYFHQATVERNIQWHISADLGIWADRSMMEQVFLNLFSNAVKFTRDQVTPVIEVTAKAVDTQAEIIVQDNGAGFDMRFQDKLFQVFQRLHLASEFEGTGIGLANVARSIERHQGTITGKGELGKGACFTIHLPINRPAGPSL